MAALDLDVFRRCALLFAAALPRDIAIATTGHHEHRMPIAARRALQQLVSRQESR
jgi:hypothetical protein